ncbi:MAG: NADPH-dependent glutamate synthase [Ruminococcus sp.]|nr:NADPH-dependent glutamate synthase [Ruminococcus sp.]
MPNMSHLKTPSRELDPEVRCNNFEEVCKGYTNEMAVCEAMRCLDCATKPCVSGCPVNVNIPLFIKRITEEDYLGAYSIILETNSFPAICGRVCPQESQCEAKCVRSSKGDPVAIGRLERFVADYYSGLNNEIEKIDENYNLRYSNIDTERVALIGSGPASLSCASDLVKFGFDVTVFEAFHTTGGVLVYGIPEFRLPKNIVKSEISELKKLGCKFRNNIVVGKTFTIDDLFKVGYSAVFIGTGAGVPAFLNIPGENLVGVFSANEYLTRINLMKAHIPKYDTPLFKSKRVAVIGGGNVAMDAARCAVRCGAEKVFNIYRRSETEMPARIEEITHAREEGVRFISLANPVEILGENADGVNRVNSVKCIRMDLGEPDESGRRKPFEVLGSEFEIEVDTVIVAIGTSPNPILSRNTHGLDLNERGLIKTDEKCRTSRKFVYAGGDAVTGAATVISAMGAGKIAAQTIMDDFS